MSTPPRLVELQCTCGAIHWEIDRDARGMDGHSGPYEARHYECRACGFAGAGFKVLRMSPPEFFLQPHPMYPMTKIEFDGWVEIFREHFPDSPRLKDLGKTWRPPWRRKSSPD